MENSAESLGNFKVNYSTAPSLATKPLMLPQKAAWTGKIFKL